MPLALQVHFDYHKSVIADAKNAEHDPADAAVSRIAAAIGEPARARMLCCLMDGHARTSTELAIVAEVSPSTASIHLSRLKQEKLVRVLAQGKHRYYSLEGPGVARVLEGLSVLANGGARGAAGAFTPNVPNRLRAARTCYDHIAGAIGVRLHDRLWKLGWLSDTNSQAGNDYELTRSGAKALEALGIDVDAVRAARRRFAYGCLDWSERRPHVGGSLGAALLGVALERKWVTQDLDSRALSITRAGRRELQHRFGLENLAE